MHIYTQEEIEFIRTIVKEKNIKESAKLFSQEFGWEANVNQLKGCMVRNGIKTGRTGRFEKGCVSHNKGKKGLRIPGSEKGWFKKGSRPVGHRPVGSERMSVEGYMEVKVKEPNIWKLKHRVEWEKVNGEIPKDSVVVFKSNDRTDTSMENLIMIPKAVSTVMNSRGLNKYEGEEKRSSNQHCKIKITNNEKKKTKD